MPLFETIRVETFISLLQVLYSLPMQIEMCFKSSSYIHYNRQLIAEAAIEAGSKYLIFIDADMVFTPDSISRLIKHNKDIVGANYYTRVTPSVATIKLDDGKGGYKEGVTVVEKGLFQCAAVGAGFMLINLECLKKIPKPWFDFETINGDIVGEDVYFCKKARQYGVEIWCDSTIKIGHIGSFVYQGQDFTFTNSSLTAMIYDNKQYTGYRDIGIPGFMQLDELNWLHEQAKKMDSILEIGSWMGRSSHALLTGCKGKVTCVDHFKGSIETDDGTEWMDDTVNMAKEIDVKAEFLKNVGHFPNLELIAKTSEEAFEELKDREFDMVFIDGTHTYQAVKDDIIRYGLKVKKLICGHDYGVGQLGVTRAVDEFFDNVGLQNTIWYQEIV